MTVSAQEKTDIKTLDAPGAEQRPLRTIFAAQRQWLAQQRASQNSDALAFATIDVGTGHSAFGPTRAAAFRNFLESFGKAPTVTFCSKRPGTAIDETNRGAAPRDLARAATYYELSRLELEVAFANQFVTIDIETGDLAVERSEVLSRAKFSFIHGDRTAITMRIGSAPQSAMRKVQTQE